MTLTAQSPISDWADAWVTSPDISARSALATILGDTVAPLGGTVWTTDLITMAGAIGFNERLVRTSLFRLAAEGWVDNQRVGRRSQYSLTELGLRETEAAETRIYSRGEQAWDGAWTLVFLGSETEDWQTDDRELLTRLRWRGFARLASGVLAKPNDHATEATDLLTSQSSGQAQPPVAVARFDERATDPAAVVPYRDDSGLAEAEEAYQRFLDRYRWLDDVDLDRLQPVECFTLRTMVVHDLRRARLRDPDLPAPLLSRDWIGGRAIDRAGSIYREVTDRAWTWVTETTGLSVDQTTDLNTRFARPTDGGNP